MLNISKEKLNNLDFIGSGNFGTIYKYNDKAIKVYKKEVKTDYYHTVDNPLLSHSILTKYKCKKLMCLNDKINNTDLIEDLLYIDNKFSGVVLPYYDGKTLNESLNINYDKKIEYSKKLVLNAEELTNNNIYPFDYKLDNIIASNDMVKIIDLDDVFTKVTILSNKYYERKSIYLLAETIKTFLNEYSNKFYPDEVYEYIDRDLPPSLDTYKGINEYLNKKSVKRNVMFIDNNSKLLDINFNNYNVVFTYNKFNKEQIINYLKYLRDSGVYITDILYDENKESFINNNSINECVQIDNNSVLRLK